MIFENNNMFINNQLQNLNSDMLNNIKTSTILWVDRKKLFNLINKDLYQNNNKIENISLNFNRYIKSDCKIFKTNNNLNIIDLSDFDMIKLSYNAILYNYANIKIKIYFYIINKKEREGIFYNEKRGRYERKK